MTNATTVTQSNSSSETNTSADAPSNSSAQNTTKVAVQEPTSQAQSSDDWDTDIVQTKMQQTETPKTSAQKSDYTGPTDIDDVVVKQ